MESAVITWDRIAEVCPNEVAAINEILDEYDIRFSAFAQGVAGEADWHDVVDIRDFHLEISELDEAKLEDKLIADLDAAWTSLVEAFRKATYVDGVALEISEDKISFVEHNSGDDEVLFHVDNFFVVTPAGKKFADKITFL